MPASAADVATTCPFCGTANAPKPKVIERVVEKEKLVDRVVIAHGEGIPCPRCGDRLRERKVNQTTLRGCERCGGLWIDNASVQRLMNARDTDVEEAARKMISIVIARIDCKPRIVCPDCKQTTERRELEGTIFYLDFCKEHGTWFDYRELPEMIRVFSERRAGELDEEDLAAAGLPGSSKSESDGSFFSDLFVSMRKLVSP